MEAFLNTTDPWNDVAFIVYLFFISILLIIASYILISIAYSKALKLMHYQKTWMGWIPVVKNYALADCIKSDNGKITFLNSEMDSTVFNVLCLIMGILQFSSINSPTSILYYIAKTLLLGTCFTHIYAYVEGKNKTETAAIGYVSGLFGIVAIFKILSYPKNA